jgi:3-dehydroquinate synthase class II
MLMIMGLSYGAAPPETKRAGYEWLIGAATRGELSVEAEALALESVAAAWQRVQAGAHRKIVLVPAARAQAGGDR